MSHTLLIFFRRFQAPARRLLAIGIASACIALVTGCSSVPLTGRSQLSLVSDAQMLDMSTQQYQQVLQESQLSTNQQQIAMVREVGQRIAAATEQFVRDNNHNISFQWEFNVIADDAQVNAWCMPGGKIAFYSGIMPYCQDERGIAVVMGHEVAHALAKHSSERVSHMMLAQYGMTAFADAMSAQPAQTQNMWMTAVGAGLQVGVMLPFNRKQELEADRIGLILTAMAGYDPRAAVPFWQRMAASGGQKPPEMLSTHPSDQRRITSLQKLMPEALTHYQPR